MNKPYRFNSAFLSFIFLTLNSFTVSAQIDSCGAEPTDMILTFGQSVSCSIDHQGDSDTFRFSGIKGEVILLEVNRTSGSGGNPCIELINPDSSSLGINCAASNSNFVLQPTLSQSGLHVVRVSSQLSSQTFDYILILHRVVPYPSTSVTLHYGDIRNEKFEFPIDLDFYTFYGSMGDNIDVSVARTSGSGGAPCIELFDLDLNIIQSVCGGSSIILNQTLPETAVYSLKLSANQTRTFDYTLDFQCITGICNSTPPVPPDLEIANTAGGLTTAVIQGGISNDAGATYTNVVEVGNAIWINANIIPEASHVGEDLNVVLAVEILATSQFILLTSDGLIPYSPGDPIAFFTNIRNSTENNSLSFLSGFMLTEAEVGNYNFYVGYSVEGGDGNLYYTSDPIALTIAN